MVAFYLANICLARWMGATEFGLYAFAWSWAMILSHLVGGGIHSAAIRFVPEYRARGDDSRLNGLLRRSLQLTLATAVGLALLCGLAVYLFETSIAAYYVLPLLFAFANILPQGLFNLQLAIGRTFDHPLLAFAPKLLGPPAMIFATGLVVIYLMEESLTAPIVLAALCGGTLLVAILQYWALRRRLPPALESVEASYETKTWLTVGFPLLIGAGSHIILAQVDQVMIGMFMTPQDVGIYSAAIRTSIIVPFVFAAVNAMATPKIIQRYTEGRHDEVRSLLTRIAHLVFWPGLFGGLAVIYFGREILGLFGPVFVAGYAALVILIGSQLLKICFGAVGELLSLSGHHRLAMWIMLFAVLVNIVLNWILIPIYGLVGAAIAMAAANLVWPLGSWIALRIKKGLDPSIIGALVALFDSRSRRRAAT